MTMFFAGEPSPEQRAALEQQHARRVEFRNGVKHMMQEMPTHHLWLLKTMFAGIGRDHDTPCEMAMHTEGLLTAYLEMRGVCVGCGVDHLEEEMKEGLFQPGTAPQSQPVEPQANPPVTGGHEHQAAMDAYHVKHAPVEGSPDRVVCTGRCGGNMEWPSLDDRMATSPDECPQCINTTKWG